MNVVEVKLPPLRERKADIPLLAATFLEEFSGSPANDAHAYSLSGEALHRLMSYDWPGNVRELKNVIQRAVSLAPGPVVGVADLPLALHHATGDHVPERRKLLPL